jgi:hypothetical protein
MRDGGIVPSERKRHRIRLDDAVEVSVRRQIVRFEAWRAVKRSALLGKQRAAGGFRPARAAALGLGVTQGRSALLLGGLAGFAKALGITRWLFLMPGLAAAYTAADATDATQAAIAVVYEGLKGLHLVLNCPHGRKRTFVVLPAILTLEQPRRHPLDLRP